MQRADPRHHLHGLRGLLIAALSMFCASCASAPVKHEGRPAGKISLPLSGVYRATIIPPFDFIGPISGRISAQPTSTGFIAASRPGIAWDMIGGVQGFLGSIFVPFVFPGGTIGTWTSAVPADGKPAMGWFGVGGIKSAGVRTRITAADKDVELLVQDGRRVGLLRLEPDIPDGPPLADYPALADEIERAIQTRLYDAKLLDNAAIGAYARQVKANSRLARDDIEFIFGTVAAARNHIRFTMPLVFKKGDPVSRAAMTDWRASELTTLRATLDEKTGIATFRVDAFLQAADVDQVFRQILSWKPKGIIVDLRTAPGVTLASLRTLSWVCTEPVAAGTWFGPSRREDLLAGKSGEVPDVTLASAASVEEIESTLDTKGAVRITVKPESDAFRGPVTVITSKRTSASAEPLVWALKNARRAPVFGQTTAGKPLLSRPIDIGQKWVLWLAAADYISPTGERLNDKGIKPDFEFSSKEAAERAAQKRILQDAGGSADAHEPSTPDKAGSILAPFFKAAAHGQ